MVHKTDEEITTTPSCLGDSVTHSHPSYGMINVSRFTSSHPVGKFGTDVNSTGGISITIGNADVKQDLGRNWYHRTNTLVEVVLSNVQYAELISSPNTEGVPCTIQYTKEQGQIVYRPIDNQTTYIESKIESQVAELKRELSELKTNVKKILEKKTALNNSDKKEVVDLVATVTNRMTSTLPFYEEQLAKSINKLKVDARVDIDAFVQHAIHRAGITSINANGVEALKLAISDKED